MKKFNKIYSEALSFDKTFKAPDAEDKDARLKEEMIEAMENFFEGVYKGVGSDLFVAADNFSSNHSNKELTSKLQDAMILLQSAVRDLNEFYIELDPEK